jgi:hypothetical protein
MSTAYSRQNFEDLAAYEAGQLALPCLKAGGIFESSFNPVRSDRYWFKKTAKLADWGNIKQVR